VNESEGFGGLSAGVVGVKKTPRGFGLAFISMVEGHANSD
jgi:hypothetical protein